MKLISQSSSYKILNDIFNIKRENNTSVIALAGNPNTGKSTMFNSLTGLRQHTGNWPGKTVIQSQGHYYYKKKKYILVDLPGTYSLLANSTEEQIARDFICFAHPDITIVVVDATNIERNLNLVLQVCELTNNIIVCLNLMDEARKKNIEINIEGLRNDLNIPVIPTVARDNIGLNQLKESIRLIINKKEELNPVKINYSGKIEEELNILTKELEPVIDNINPRWLALRLLEGDKTILESIKSYYAEELNDKLNNNIESEAWNDGLI
jgi:Fe2+ transport system protein B